MIRLWLIAGSLVIITLIHSFLGVGVSGWLHSLLGHLYIAPIIMAAYWFGFPGGVISAVFSTALFFWHFFHHWPEQFVDIYNFVEIFLFFVIGVTTGVLSQMERSHRAKYEEALVRLDESHRKLREQTEILFQTEEQLRRADRLSALGELSAGMAHEIRNPLGAIKGAAEILKDDYGPDAPKAEFIRILLKETDRLNAIVEEFLNFARPKPPTFGETDINQVLDSVLTLTAQSARKSGISVEKRLDPSIGMRNLDSELLKQAFLNLILNAIQAMPNGGTLTVETKLKNGFIMATIADTGTGISAAHRKRLFTPFFTTKNDGTGLGLAITFRIVQNHKGAIDVESEEGKGTAFTVRIPV